jgi:hypothetical protein
VVIDELHYKVSECDFRQGRRNHDGVHCQWLLRRHILDTVGLQIDDFAVINQGKRKPWNFPSLHHVSGGSVDLSIGARTPVNSRECRLGVRL